MTEFADNNFKFDENGRKFSKWEEMSDFPFSPTVFQKTSTADTLNKPLVWEKAKSNGCCYFQF